MGEIQTRGVEGNILLDIPTDLYRTNDVMSNLDHNINREVELELKSGKCFSGYPAINFFGWIWFDGNCFICNVMRYGTHIETIISETLEDIMEKCCEKYGRF